MVGRLSPVGRQESRPPEKQFSGESRITVKVRPLADQTVARHDYRARTTDKGAPLAQRYSLALPYRKRGGVSEGVGRRFNSGHWLNVFEEEHKRHPNRRNFAFFGFAQNAG